MPTLAYPQAHCRLGELIHNRENAGRGVVGVLELDQVGCLLVQGDARDGSSLVLQLLDYQLFRLLLAERVGRLAVMEPIILAQ